MAPSHQFLKCVLLFFRVSGNHVRIPCIVSSLYSDGFPQGIKHFLTLSNAAQSSGTVATTTTTTTITSQLPLSPTTVTTSITTTNITTTTITTTTTDECLFSHLPLQVFEGSLARKLRFHIFNFHTFWGKSRTKASFSHLQLSVFEGSLSRKLLFHILHFQFQQLIPEKSEPCHVLRLLATHLRWATCGKKNSFSASNGPASGR